MNAVWTLGGLGHVVGLGVLLVMGLGFDGAGILCDVAGDLLDLAATFWGGGLGLLPTDDAVLAGVAGAVAGALLAASTRLAGDGGVGVGAAAGLLEAGLRLGLAGQLHHVNVL